MKFTSPDNIPYPESTDGWAPLEQWFADLATAVQRALPKDTGWQSAGYTVASGASVASGVQFRRVGNVASIVIPSATVTTVRTLNTGVVSGRADILTLPEEFRPSKNQALATGSGGRMAWLELRPDGVLTIVGLMPNVTQSSTTNEPNVNVAVSGSYFLN